jgi:hypothetical protein
VGSVWRCVERLKFAILLAVEFANNYDILSQDCLAYGIGQDKASSQPDQDKSMLQMAIITTILSQA